MNVIIDAGNTRLKVAHFKNNELLHFWVATDLESFKNNWQRAAPSKILVSNVGAWPLLEMLAQHNVTVLSTKTPLPFRVKYKTPQTLGNDRRGLAAAAVKEYPGQPVLVVDAGTCVTYDFITKEGAYLGGAIAPGLAMRFKALRQFTAHLPLLSAPNQSPALIGDSTQNSIESGVVLGFTAEVEKTIERYKARYPNLVVVLTGGDLNQFGHLTKNSIFARPNFLLNGLNYILEYNA